MKKGIICLIAGIVIGIALAVGAMFIVRNINGGKADEGTMTRGTGDAVEYTDAGAARETRPVWNESNPAAQQSSLQRRRRVRPARQTAQSLRRKMQPQRHLPHRRPILRLTAHIHRWFQSWYQP